MMNEPDLSVSQWTTVCIIEELWLHNKHYPKSYGTKNGLNLLGTEFYDEGIKNLVQHYDRCLSRGGDYIEK